MSYQVLARKWRPKSFETLVGQEHVVRALTHALNTGRLHHAYLFTGTRGVGKTTISRILAKSLNCEQGVTATPCGVCAACTEIDTGRFVDYVEMDAASNRGVDDMAALLEKAAYAPSRGRYKVYMIDEVHMLTGHAFNAMLKTLEEPPAHMKFILATTDPQKIPVTVLSRCLQFNLKQMPQTHIVEHLSGILTQEAVPFEPTALRHIAKGASGSMRDALSLLDQAIAHGAGKVEEEGVRDMLGTVGEDHLYELLAALQAGDAPALLAAAEAMQARSLNFDSALQEFAVLLHRVALTQFAPQAIADPLERERLSPYAAALAPEFLQLAYQVCVHAREEMALAPDEFTGFSMALLRLHAFRPALPGAVAALGAGVPRPEPVLAPGAAAPVASHPVPSPLPVAPVAAPAAAQPEAVLTPEAPPLEPSTPPAEAAAPLAVAPSAVAAGPVLDWHATIQGCGVGGMVRELAQNCELLADEDGLLRLRLASTHHHLNAAPANANKLQEALSAYLARSVRLKIEVGEVQSETPAQRNEAERRAAHAEAVASLETDPFVQELVERFDATLVESSVKPLSGESR